MSEDGKGHVCGIVIFVEYGSLTMILSAVEVEVFIQTYVSSAKLCSGHNCLVIPVSPQLPDIYAEFTVESFIFGQYLNSFPVGQTAVIADLGHGQPYLWELQLFSSRYLSSFINFGSSLVYTPGDITNNKQIWMVFKYIYNHKWPM